MRDRNWLIKSPVLHSRSSQGDSNCSLMTMSIRVITCSCHNGLFSVWTQWNLLLLVSHDDDVGQAATRASSPLSDLGTQGFSDIWLYQVTWIPADPLPSANNEHKTTVYKTDRKVVLLQSKRVGVVHDKLLQKGFCLSVSGDSFPPRPPARFAMPTARGKTSLNARDWWKGKELFIQKLHKLRIMT